jgi:hypothetical protein
MSVSNWCSPIGDRNCSASKPGCGFATAAVDLLLTADKRGRKELKSRKLRGMIDAFAQVALRGTPQQSSDQDEFLRRPWALVKKPRGSRKPDLRATIFRLFTGQRPES